MKLDSLSLVQGASYNVLVMASDESGGCAQVVGSFTVDTTPPVEGNVTIGERTTMVSQSFIYYSFILHELSFGTYIRFLLCV